MFLMNIKVYKIWFDFETNQIHMGEKHILKRLSAKKTDYNQSRDEEDRVALEIQTGIIFKAGRDEFSKTLLLTIFQSNTLSFIWRWQTPSLLLCSKQFVPFSSVEQNTQTPNRKPKTKHSTMREEIGLRSSLIALQTKTKDEKQRKKILKEAQSNYTA